MSQRGAVRESGTKRPHCRPKAPATLGAPNDFDQHVNALRAQYRYEARRKQFQDIIQSKGNAHKYGKFMYDYKSSTLTITNVYGSSKLSKGSKIYEGSLL